MDKISPVRIDKVSLTFINDSYVQIDSSNQDCLHECLCGNDCVVSERNFICNYDNDTLDCDNPIRSMPHLVGQCANKVSSSPCKNDFGDFVYKDCGNDNLREDQSPPHNIGHHSPKKNVDNSDANSNMNNHVLNNDTNPANVNSDYLKNFINKDDVFDNVNKFINNDDVNKGINNDYVNDNLNCIKTSEDVNKGVNNDCVNDIVNNINHEDIYKGINNDYVNNHINNGDDVNKGMNNDCVNDNGNSCIKNGNDVNKGMNNDYVNVNVNNRINNGDDVNKGMINDCVNDDGNSWIKNGNDVNKGMNNNYVNDDVNNSLKNGDDVNKGNDVNKGMNNYYVNYVMVENVNSVVPCNSNSTFGDDFTLLTSCNNLDFKTSVDIDVSCNSNSDFDDCTLNSTKSCTSDHTSCNLDSTVSDLHDTIANDISLSDISFCSSVNKEHLVLNEVLSHKYGISFNKCISNDDHIDQSSLHDCVVTPTADKCGIDIERPVIVSDNVSHVNDNHDIDSCIRSIPSIDCDDTVACPLLSDYDKDNNGISLNNDDTNFIDINHSFQCSLKPINNEDHVHGQSDTKSSHGNNKAKMSHGSNLFCISMLAALKISWRSFMLACT